MWTSFFWSSDHRTPNPRPVLRALERGRLAHVAASRLHGARRFWPRMAKGDIFTGYGDQRGEKMEQDEIVPILKPCPFCGDRPQIVQVGTFIVQCADCGASGPPAPNMERAAVQWNKRKGDGFG